MNSEVEIEHAFVQEGEGELEMEQLYFEQNFSYLGINDTFIKYGTVLMLLGITNETMNTNLVELMKCCKKN